jgi:hypothetical protein
VLDSILEQIVSPMMSFVQFYVRKTVKEQNYTIPAEVKILF